MRKCTGECYVVSLSVMWCHCVLCGVSSEIGQEIKRSQKLIVDYKEELKKSRVIRCHRQEYDAMAKVCHETSRQSVT